MLENCKRMALGIRLPAVSWTKPCRFSKSSNRTPRAALAEKVGCELYFDTIAHLYLNGPQQALNRIPSCCSHDDETHLRGGPGRAMLNPKMPSASWETVLLTSSTISCRGHRSSRLRGFPLAVRNRTGPGPSWPTRQSVVCQPGSGGIGTDLVTIRPVTTA
jgi:hypothetical protein